LWDQLLQCDGFRSGWAGVEAQATGALSCSPEPSAGKDSGALQQSPLREALANYKGMP
jgi:hypothetical protein